MGRQPLDVAGRSREADELTYLFQVGMLGEQCAYPLIPSVVQHSDLERGGVVAAAVVPIARRVPNQPASQVIKVGDQNVWLPVRTVDGKLVEHQARADLVGVEEVQCRLRVGALGLLNPQ